MEMRIKLNVSTNTVHSACDFDEFLSIFSQYLF